MKVLLIFGPADGQTVECDEKVSTYNYRMPHPLNTTEKHPINVSIHHYQIKQLKTQWGTYFFGFSETEVVPKDINIIHYLIEGYRNHELRYN